MGNIKQKLEADAATIVGAYRESGGSLDEHVAKYASSKGYKGEQVRSLTALVNRRAFKAAMMNGREDEPQIANADAVLMQMQGGAAKAATKQASVPRPYLGQRLGLASGQASSAEHSTDYGPYFRSKLAAREQELGGQSRMLNARIRENLSTMERLGQSIKLAGLGDSERFKAEAFKGVSSEAADLVGSVLEKLATQAVAMADPELRNLIPRAVRDGMGMAKCATAILADMDVLLDAEHRLDKAASIKRELADGLEA